MVYAIWLTHLDDVSAQQLHTDPSALSTSLSSSEAEAVLRARHAPGSPELRLMATFNNLLSRAIHMLPHHARAVDDDLAFEYRLDARRRGPSVVERSLLPRLRVDYKCLSPSHVSLYREYYARPSPAMCWSAVPRVPPHGHSELFQSVRDVRGWHWAYLIDGMLCAAAAALMTVFSTPRAGQLPGRSPH